MPAIPTLVLEAMLAVLMVGRLAEEIFIGEITTGAGNDIERASAIARRMFREWGMSDLGPVTFGKKEEAIFLSRELAQQQDFSKATAVEIAREVKRILDKSLRPRQRNHHRPQSSLDRIAQKPSSAKRWKDGK